MEQWRDKMELPGIHQMSIPIKRKIKDGREITNLWTNGKFGYWGISVVEFNDGLVYVVNDSGTLLDSNNFQTALNLARISFDLKKSLFKITNDSN